MSLQDTRRDISAPHKIKRHPPICMEQKTHPNGPSDILFKYIPFVPLGALSIRGVFLLYSLHCIHSKEPRINIAGSVQEVHNSRRFEFMR